MALLKKEQLAALDTENAQEETPLAGPVKLKSSTNVEADSSILSDLGVQASNLMTGKTLRDTARSVVSGASQGLLEMMKTGLAMTDIGANIPGPLGGPMAAASAVHGALGTSDIISEIKSKVDQVWQPPDTLPQNLVQAMSQWVTAAGPAGKSLAIKNGLLKWGVAGGIADFSAFDPYEERISNILTKFDNPVFNNALTQWLQMDEDDPELEARMKQSVEGTVVGLGFEGLMALGRVAKGSMKARQAVEKIVKETNRLKVSGKELLDDGEEEIVISGEPRLGETFATKEYSSDSLVSLMDETNRFDDEVLTSTAARIQAGEKPVVVVKTVGGKPVEIVEGGDVIQLMNRLGKTRMSVRTIEAPSHEKIMQDALKVEEAFKESEGFAESALNKVTRALGDILSKQKWIDVAAPIRDKLIAAGSREAENAVMKLDMAAGATAKARLEFQQAANAVYDGLDKDGVRDLDRLITAHYNVQTDLRRKGADKVVHPKGLVGAQYDNYISALKQRIGAAKFGDLQRRSRIFFDAQIGQLKQMKDAGLIDDELYNKLSKLDYTRTEYLKEIDPETTYELGGRKITVSNSGIQHFDGGKNEPVNMDQRLLLSERVVITQARIARNEANKALKQFAATNKNNGIASIEKVKGWVPIKVMEKGKPTTFYISPDVAASWVTTSPEITQFMGSLLRIASGTSIVKPLATGYNPAFSALVGFPMDVAMAFMSTQAKAGYSPHLPKFLGQMAIDLAETASDAFGKKGEFIDYINEKGGMDFLTHQGRSPLSSAGKKGFNLLSDVPDSFAASKNIDNEVGRIKDALSYVGESFEAWMRLAIRKRGLKTGLSPEEASYQARRYFDLARGGSAAKALDNASPYFNAMTQGFRGVGREAKADPKRFATKVAWLAGMGTAWHFANYSTNPVAYEAISDKKKVTHMNITTPLSFKDAQGNRRHVYFSIKKDPTTSLLTMPFDAAAINMFSEKGIDASTIDALGEAFVKISSLVPSLAAYHQYTKNKDFWNKEMWRSGTVPVGKIDPKLEYIGDGSMSGDTSEIYKQLGATFNMSPVRLQGALQSVAPANPFTEVLGMSYQMMMKGLPQDLKDQNSLMLIANAPMMNRVIKLTHPLEKAIEAEQELGKPFANERAELDRQLNIRLKKYERGHMQIPEIKQWLKAVKRDEQPRVAKRLENFIEVDRIYKKFSKNEIPAKSWWVGLANEPIPEIRGEVFYWKWRDAEASDRKAMVDMAGGVAGFWSPQAAKQFQKNLKDYGDAY